MSTRPSSNLPDEAQPWRRSIEKDLAALQRQGGIDRTNNASIQKVQGSLAAAIAKAGLDIADQAGAIQDARRAPAAPANPSVTTDAYFDEYGMPRAKVYASCDPVFADSSGAAIDVAYYELFGRPSGTTGAAWQRLAETYTVPPTFEFAPLPAGEEWEFCMGAVSSTSVPGERSAVVAATLAKDTTPPPKPSKPTGASRLGQVVISWDGKTSTGGAQPADFARAEVLMSSSLNGAGVKVGDMDTNGDTFYAPQIPYNETRWYFLVAIDVAGNRSTPSERVDVITKPLVDTDVIGEVISGANIVEGSINAAEKIIGETITGELIQALAIQAGHIEANAITSDKIDAGAITTVKLGAGSITADKIQARAVSADKLTIGNVSNFIQDPSCLRPIGDTWKARVGALSAWAYGGASALPGIGIFADANSTTKVLTSNYRIAVSPGEKYAMGCRAFTSTAWAGSAPVMQVVWYRADGTVAGNNSAALGPTNGAWLDYSAIFTAPTTGTASDSVCYAEFEFLFLNTSTAGRFMFGNAYARAAATGELIVNGAITGEKISADAIDGKTITGALIRSSASGARTELTNQGLRVLNAANQELVKMGFGLTTGMQVRNPATGTLVSIADAAFGLVSASAANAISYNAQCSPEGVQSSIARLAGDACVLTFTAVSSAYVVDFSETWTIGYFDPLSITVVPFVGLRVNGAGVTSGGERVMARSATDLAAWQTTGWRRVAQARGAVRIATTPGTTYTLDMDFSTYGVAGGTASAAVTLRDRFITATPVFQ